MDKHILTVRALKKASRLFLRETQKTGARSEFGSSARNWRASWLGANRACGLLLVVGLRERLGCADKPNCCIKRTTRFREQWMPRSLSTA